MLAELVLGTTVAVFALAGLANLAGPRALKDDYARWGYPRWWNCPTGLLELATATLIALRGLYLPVGLWLGTTVLVGATLTILVRREIKHIAPLALFWFLIIGSFYAA